MEKPKTQDAKDKILGKMCQLSNVKMDVVLINEILTHSKKLKHTQDESTGFLCIIFHLTGKDKDDREPDYKWEPMGKKVFSVQGI